MSSNPGSRVGTFRPEVFEVATLDQAKAITVTVEEGTTTEERWEKETFFLLEDICKCLAIGKDSCVLDYGCGTGRVAKGLIDRTGCRVVGVDSSKAMRLLSPEYVLSERFTVCSPDVLQKIIAKGFAADFAICLWVIQHALYPSDVIQRIYTALRPNGVLYALNQQTRCVPTDIGWLDDGFDVKSGLRQAFQEEDFRSLPLHVTTAQISAVSMIQVLRKASTQPISSS
jgi:SAM-dependent methyltransferase